MSLIYIVNIDIKDGWYDTIYAYTNKSDAEDCVNRLEDPAYISVVELDPPGQTRVIEQIVDEILAEPETIEALNYLRDR